MLKPRKKYHYSWWGLNSTGQKISGELNAQSRLHVKIFLRRQNITTHSIRRKIFLFDKKIPDLSLALFFRQLSTLLEAGIPILQALQTLSDVEHHDNFKKIIRSLKEIIASGNPFVKGLQKYPRYFNTFICNLIQLGEQTGKLNSVLLRAAQYKEKSILLKKQFKEVLFYPVIISVTALIVTLIMLIYIVPRFAELFQNSHHSLPTITRAVFFLSIIMRRYSIVSLPAIGVLMLFFYHYRESITLKMHVLSTRISYIKNITQKILLSRFTRGLAIAFSSGIPILQSLKILSQSTRNPIYMQAFVNLQKEVEKGRQLHAAMQINSLFPHLMVQLVKIGEESGMLEKMLEKIADLYESDIDHLLSTLKQLLEPLIMIILGVLIGGLVVAMYLPIFKLGTIF